MPTASRRLLPFAPFFFAAIAACGGQSCSCLKPIQGGFPTDDRRHPNALQVRVTQSALDYLSAKGPGLVGSLLGKMGMGTTFDIPPSCGGKNEVCCLGGQPQMCPLDLGVGQFALKPDPTTNALALDVVSTLKSQSPIPITINQLITAQCFFAIDTMKGTAGHKDIELISNVTFAVDKTTNLTNITLGGTMVKNLDASMLDITPQSGFLNQLACGAANLGFIKGFIITQLQSQLTSQIDSAAGNAFCAKCAMQSDCDGFADGCSGGKCQRMGKCLQEVGAAGKLDVGGLFSKLSPGTQAGLDTLAVLGGYADVTPAPTSGLSLGMIGGGQADPHNACVPMRVPPMPPQVGKWMAYTGENEPLTKKPYHIGFGVHVSHLNTMGYAAFDAGALCLDVGTPSVALLSAQTLAVLLPSMQDLLHSQNAPVFLVMRPAQEPQITLGQGTFNVDAMGMKTIKDPLLHINVPHFAIDFYAFVEERYVRMMTLTADVVLGVSLDVDATGKLVPLLGDLTKAFTNVQVTNSELLAEDPKKLATAFPMLLGLAVGQIGGVLKPIALPAVMGLNLSIVAIAPTDNLQFLSFFANLSVPTMDAFHATTHAELARVIVPPTEAFRLAGGLDPARQPRVVLRLGGASLDGTASGLEWSTRVDDGLWSPYSAVREPEVTDPQLWLQGRHHLDVRARMVDAAETTDPDPPRLEFLVDTVAPNATLGLDPTGDAAIVSATDLVSPPSALLYAVWNGAAWGPWTHETRVPLAALDPDLVRVAVSDEVGNITIVAFHGRTTAPKSGGCGCHVGARGGAPGGALFAALGLLALLARRRARSLSRMAVRAGATVALVVVGSAACSHDAFVLAKGDQENPTDEIGRYSDALVHAGAIYVSAYDDSVGDLAYAEIKEGDLAKPLQWQWADGVPTGAPVDTPGGFRHGTAAGGDDVGLYSSLAVTRAGDPRIAYYDATNQQLKLARAPADTRVWTATVVDHVPNAKVGLYASLSLDKSDLPSIAYVVTGLQSASGNGFVSRLRLATAKTPLPTGPGDWTLQDLDESPIPCAGTGKTGLCPTGQACVDADKNDHSKSVCKSVDAMCPKGQMCSASQACIAGACTDVLIPVAAPDLIEGIGLFAQLRRLASGNRVVAYYDREHGSALLQVESGGGMFTKLIVDGNDPTVDVGQFIGAAVAPDDTIHLTYVDAIADRLLYRNVSGTTVSPAEVVDDGMRAEGPRPVGGGATLWTDGKSVRVLYQEQAVADLWMAVRGGGGWTKHAVRSGAPGFGFYPHLINDGAQLFLTEFVYDRMTTNLGSLEVRTLAN